MKVFSVVMKIVVALAAIAGAVYVAATYGDKIVAWAKKLLNCSCCCDDECCCEAECDCDDIEVEIVEAPAEECCCGCEEETAE